jgi:hypothetical protein
LNSRSDLGERALGLHEPQGVLAHDATDLVVAEAREIVHEIGRELEALGVRPVGPEKNVLGPDLRLELLEVVLVVGRDEQVLADGLARVLGRCADRTPS